MRLDPPGRGMAPIASLAVAITVLAAGMASPSVAQDSSAAPSASAQVIHDWPGTRVEPAGLYSWTEGSRSFMHKVPDDYPTSGNVEIRFHALPDGRFEMPVMSLTEPSDTVEGPFSTIPERVAATHVQAWVLDFDGRTVVVTIKAAANTSADLIAEAEAIVRSIHAETVGTGPGRRLVFTLPDGWDSG